MFNSRIADIFEEIASLLELKGGENPFRIRSYRRAALTLRGLTEDVSEIERKNGLEELPGIGADLAGKIGEYIRTGRISMHEELKRRTPKFLVQMLEIPGVGPKIAQIIYKKFEPRTYVELKRLAAGGALRGLPGIQAKCEKQILEGIEIVERKHSRFSIGEALPLARSIILNLKGIPAVNRIEYAGSLRRMCETIGDIDLLAASGSPQRVMDAFIKMKDVWKVLEHGHTRSSLVMREGIQVDLRVVENDCYGAALQYFTGSKQHNIHLRGIAKKKGFKISEYGLFKTRTGKRIASNEEDIYQVLGLSWIPPEIREDHGEIEAASSGDLPNLVEPGDLKGDLHAHTDWTDGADSIEAMAQEAKRRGLEYLVITDHSRSLRIAHGLDEKKLMAQVKAIQDIGQKVRGIRLLAGAEVDILEDGSLDYSDEVLDKLDFVVASVHSGFRQGKSRLTSRIVRAMRSGRVDLIGHPTGRLFGGRNAYELDFDEIFKTAVQTRTALEINGCPQRLDLNELNAKEAAHAGVRLAITSDAHCAKYFDHLEYGVGIARRAWCEKKNILNCFRPEIWEKGKAKLSLKAAEK